MAEQKLTKEERGFWINLEVNPELFPLSKTREYEIKDPRQDVRGWTVLDAAGKAIGQVSDLLVDTMGMRTRYLEVATVDALRRNPEKERMILLSMGAIELDAARQCVLVRQLRYEDLALGSLPISPFAGLKGYLYYKQEVFAPGLLQMPFAA